MTTNYKDRTINEIKTMLDGKSMKASIANISEHKVWMWFTNGEQLRLARPKTIAGKKLKIGSMIELAVAEKIGQKGKYSKYIFVGENNARLDDQVKLDENRLKIEPLTNFNLGKKIWKITKVSDNYITVAIANTLRKIRKPGNVSWENKEIKVGETYELELVESKSANGKKLRWLIYRNKYSPQ